LSPAARPLARKTIYTRSSKEEINEQEKSKQQEEDAEEFAI